MKVEHNNKKQIFSELRGILFEQLDNVRLSSLKNKKIIDEIKTLKVIEIDSLESFYSYTNYDYYLVFKFNDNYYFCDTELSNALNTDCMIKMIDYNQHLRKDKLDKLNQM